MHFKNAYSVFKFLFVRKWRFLSVYVICCMGKCVCVWWGVDGCVCVGVVDGWVCMFTVLFFVSYISSSTEEGRGFQQPPSLTQRCVEAKTPYLPLRIPEHIFFHTHPFSSPSPSPEFSPIPNPLLSATVPHCSLGYDSYQLPRAPTWVGSSFLKSGSQLIRKPGL